MASIREGILFGLGNPLLDIIASVDKDYLEKYGMDPNNAILAEDKHKPMYSEMVDNFEVEYVAGGATQNSIRIAQWLLQVPRSTVYMGCVGNDDFGRRLKEKAEEAGVWVNYQIDPKEPTGTCAVLITGHNRSLCANLAAANCYSKDDHLVKRENWNLVEQASYFYVSGFHLTVSPPAIMAVAEHAATQNKVFCMNLSAPFLCQFFKDPMNAAMPYVDVLFGNETEAATYAKEHDFGTEDLKEVALKLAALEKRNTKKPRMVIITQGVDPVLLAYEGRVREYPVENLPSDKIVDTNGAGDAFVGGFLSQLVQGKGEDECVRCGNYAANFIIQQSGVTGLSEKPAFQS